MFMNTDLHLMTEKKKHLQECFRLCNVEYLFLISLGIVAKILNCSSISKAKEL